MAATYMQMMDHVLRTVRQRCGVAVAASLLLLPTLSHAQGSGPPFGRPGAPVQADQDAWAEVVNNGTPTGKRIRGSYLGGSELYLRLTDLGRYLSADDRWDFKNKYELIAGDKRLKFTLDSPMVIVDNMADQAVNLLAPWSCTAEPSMPPLRGSPRSWPPSRDSRASTCPIGAG